MAQTGYWHRGNLTQPAKDLRDNDDAEDPSKTFLTLVLAYKIEERLFLSANYRERQSKVINHIFSTIFNGVPVFCLNHLLNQTSVRRLDARMSTKFING